MANKFKKVNAPSHKQAQDNSNMRTILGLVAIALVAVSVFVYWGLSSSKSNSQSNSQSNTGTTTSSQQSPSLDQLKQRVTDLEKSAQANPSNVDNQKQLGDAYYDVGYSYLSSSDMTNMQTYFAKAVGAYQKYLASNFDINVQTDMATAAFYANQPDVAEKAFKTAIAKQPDFWTAHLNYGIFLRDVRNDKAGAKAQFEIVANQTKDKDAASQASQLLPTVK